MGTAYHTVRGTVRSEIFNIPTESKVQLNATRPFTTLRHPSPSPLPPPPLPSTIPPPRRGGLVPDIMPPLAFTLPAPVPVATKPYTSSTQSRRGLRRYRLAPRAVAMTADVPKSDESQPAQSISQSDREAVVLDPDDQEFVKWISTAESEELQEHSASPLDGLAGLEEDGAAIGQPYLQFEEEGEEDTGDDDDGDDDNGEEDEEDEELAARATDEDFEDELPIEDIDTRGAQVPASRAAALAGVDEDDNDEVQDAEEIMEPLVDEIAPVFEDPVGLRKRKEPVEEEGEDVEPGVQAADEDLFGTETDEDIQNAANILSESGILGLGGAGSRKRYGIGSTESKKQAPSLGDDGFVDDLTLGADEDEDGVLDEKEKLEKEKDGLDTYVDTDSYDDDEEFALTSKSSFGRVWEFNEDNYITITDPGESYVYELDEDDQEDQEMATLRRGKAGGWSGGLMSNSASNLLEGSKEWVARRAYELVAQSNQVEMFQWTRRHKGPPPIIADLYPPDPPPPERLPKTTLSFSTPEESTPIIGMDSSGQLAAREEEEEVEEDRLPEGINYQHALDKSVNFPCQYKFKVEGSGDDLEDLLAKDLERVLGRPVPLSAFQVEPAGRYKRVVIMVDVESALQVTEVFDALRSNSGVKFSFG